MSKQLRVLLVEDSENDAVLVTRELKKGGYVPVVERVETPESMRKVLNEKTWDLVISDYVLPRFSGLDALKLLKKSGIDLPFIVVSGKIGEDTAVEAMRAGAHAESGQERVRPGRQAGGPALRHHRRRLRPYRLAPLQAKLPRVSQQCLGMCCAQVLRVTPIVDQALRPVPEISCRAGALLQSQGESRVKTE